MQTIVIKRPDTPELDSPYCAATDGDEWLVLNKGDIDTDTQYSSAICMCPDKCLALQISALINAKVLFP